MPERKLFINSSTVDLTQGNIVKQLMIFAAPIFMGELLQNLYNSVDALVVGNYVSDAALGAVSVCATLSNLLIGFFNGMSVGSSVIVARLVGKGDKDGTLNAMKVAFTFSAVLGVFLSVLGIVLTPFLVGLSKAPADVYAEAVVYLRIYLAGIMFTVIYNIGAGILRATGDSRSPFVILAAASGINIALDLLFVAVLPFGIAGVGVATVISQMFSVIMVYRRIVKTERRFRLAFSELRRNIDTITAITGIGVPSGLQGALISFSNLFVWRYISSFNSSAAIAGIGVAQRLDRFAALPSKAFGLAITTFIGQNEGAGNYKRARQGGLWSLALALLMSLIAGGILYANTSVFVALFNSEPSVVLVGSAMMRTIIPFYGFMALREICLGVLRGYGRAKIPMVLSLMGMVVFRQIFLRLALAVNHSLKIIYLGYPLGWAATAIMLTVYYFITSAGKKKRSDGAGKRTPIEHSPGLLGGISEREN